MHLADKRRSLPTRAKPRGMRSGSFRKNLILTLMQVPGLIYVVLFSYLPMFGILLAFKNYRISRGGFLVSLINSPWAGFRNFEFIFTTEDAFIFLRNTILYNVAWIILGMLIAITFAIMLNEMRSKALSKVYQTLMFFPYFLSWVVASYFVFVFLSTDKGMLNHLLMSLGIFSAPKEWYTDPKPWPIILTIATLWKGTGYSSVFYLAAICGIDRELFDAAMIDGAGKWGQTRYITLPHLRGMVSILLILAVAGILNSDFGLFYSVPRNQGQLFSVTQTIDTYVYRAMTTMTNPAMPTAVGLFKSFVGMILLFITNGIVKRIDSENSLF